LGTDARPVPNQADNGRNLRVIDFAAGRASIALYGSLSPSGSASSSFFTRERTLAGGGCGPRMLRRAPTPPRIASDLKPTAGSGR
jgi:hypothetical protein